MRHVDRYGHALTEGRSRTVEHITARAKTKYLRPLPLELACKGPRAKPTRAPHGPVHREFPTLEALTLRTLERRLTKTRPRSVPFRLVSRRRGYLGWTGDYGLMLTIVRKGEGDIYFLKG